MILYNPFFTFRVLVEIMKTKIKNLRYRYNN